MHANYNSEHNDEYYYMHTGCCGGGAGRGLSEALPHYQLQKQGSDKLYQREYETEGLYSGHGAGTTATDEAMTFAKT